MDLASPAVSGTSVYANGLINFVTWGIQSFITKDSNIPNCDAMFSDKLLLEIFSTDLKIEAANQLEWPLTDYQSTRRRITKDLIGINLGI